MSLWNVFKKKSPQELMAAGNYKAALKALNEILDKARKKDPTLLLMRADLYLKMGKRSEARKGYIEVGEYYGDEGFFNKAVAVFKKALNITPNDKEILEKLSGYNNKVPKYILDSTFLARAAGEEKPPPKAERPPVAAAEQPAPVEPETVTALPDSPSEPETITAPPPEGVEINEAETTPEFETANHEAPESDFDTANHEAPVVINSEDDGVGMGGGIDFDTLTDLSEELSAEFEKAYAGPETAKPDLPLPVPEKPKTQEPGVRVPAEQAAEQSPEGMPVGGGIVFSTRPSEVESGKGELDMAFSSLDDALDSLFASEESQPQDQDRRHWPLFRTMPEDAFMAFVIALEGRDYEPGNTIVSQGAPGDEMFLIADGEVDILIEKDGNVIKVASLGEGDFFGEASLLTGEPRNATVQATKNTSCLLLNKAHLKDLAGAHPTIMESIQTVYQARLRQNAGK